MVNLAHYADIKTLIDEVAALVEELSPNERELFHTLTVRYEEPVTGTFDDFELTLEYDAENPENSRVDARIAVASVNSGNKRRDNHLRTADFFAADEHPYITFHSTSVRQKSDGTLVARGPLSIRGVTKEVALPIKLLGVQPIPEEMRGMLGGAREIASFQMSTTIDRGDFGVGTGSWAATLVVGGEVTIDILVEAHRK